jgi:hypothetical protein
MDRRLGVLSLSVVIAGCGSDPIQADRSPALIRCLERQGGERIAQPAQLGRVPSADPQYGTSIGTDSILFESLDVDAGDDARQAVVFVEDPSLPKPSSLSAAQTLQRAGRGDLAAALPERDERRTHKVIATLVMPPSANYDHPLNACAEEVAGDEITVP